MKGGQQPPGRALVRTEYVHERDEWDTLVLDHRDGHVLQSWAWGEVKEMGGWTPRRVIVRGGSALAAAQVLTRPLLWTSVAYVPRGPMWSGVAAVDRQLVHELVEIARRRRAAFLRLEPNVSESASEAPTVSRMLEGLGLRAADPFQPRSTIRVDLRPGIDELFARMSKGHRADVRRAEHQGVTVRRGSGEADVAAFHALMVATSVRKRFPIHARSYYQRVWASFGDDAELLLAEQDGNVLAGTLVTTWGGDAVYLYAGATEAGLQRRASHLLQWAAIQHAKERQCLGYDLWGIPEAEPTASTARGGVYRFKKGWGGETVRFLPAYDRVFLPPLYHVWRWRRSRQPSV